MLTAIKITNFRSIRAMTEFLPLRHFHVLVGPNGSGKSTFLDAIDFVRDCLSSGPRAAVEQRATEFRDLTWMRRGGAIEIACRLEIATVGGVKLLNYEISIIHDNNAGVLVGKELLLELPPGPSRAKPKRILGKTEEGTDFYRRAKGTRVDSFALGMDRLALSLVIPDLEHYPSGNAVKDFLLQGIRFLQLDSRAMRWPCPATSPISLELDGTNLARAVGRLQGAVPLVLPNGRYVLPLRSRTGGRHREDPLARWTAHLRYAIPDLQEIVSVRRREDNAEYVVLIYKDGLQCPSWLLSDGTLRMLALTLIAYLPPAPRIYLVEEPENGVHPWAMEIILQSLSSIPDAQTLVATHSPQVVLQVNREDRASCKTPASGFRRGAG